MEAMRTTVQYLNGCVKDRCSRDAVAMQPPIRCANQRLRPAPEPRINKLARQETGSTPLDYRRGEGSSRRTREKRKKPTKLNLRENRDMKLLVS